MQVNSYQNNNHPSFKEIYLIKAPKGIFIKQGTDYANSAFAHELGRYVNRKEYPLCPQPMLEKILLKVTDGENKAFIDNQSHYFGVLTGKDTFDTFEKSLAQKPINTIEFKNWTEFYDSTFGKIFS